MIKTVKELIGQNIFFGSFFLIGKVNPDAIKEGINAEDNPMNTPTRYSCLNELLMSVRYFTK